MTGTIRQNPVDPGEILLVNKPKGWTSFDVVNKLRRVLHVRKAGHAGTLDPMATGLLIVCTGQKTKELSQFLGMPKEYRAEMTLGARTPSYDTETAVSSTSPIEGLTDDAIRSALAAMIGTQLQIPPMFSAVKVGGKRLYRMARKGAVVDRPPRSVDIYGIEGIEIARPVVRFTVRCSKGTYVRSLVNDVGERLGCGAYLSGLVRTGIGEYRLDNALTIDMIQERMTLGREAHA
jgi:tRNA pseudouridine55 synthase